MQEILRMIILNRRKNSNILVNLLKNIKNKEGFYLYNNKIDGYRKAKSYAIILKLSFNITTYMF
jgi:hypothetical protein